MSVDLQQQHESNNVLVSGSEKSGVNIISQVDELISFSEDRADALTSMINLKVWLINHLYCQEMGSWTLTL